MEEGELKAMLKDLHNEFRDCNHNQIIQSREINKMKNVILDLDKKIEKLNIKIEQVYAYYGCRTE